MTPPIAMILAGGLSRRMGGGDKGLQRLGRSTLLGHVIARIEPQVADLALNANGDAARFARFGVPVLADSLPDHPGPLAGVLAAMDWATTRGAERVFTVSGDTPFLPGDLIPQLLLASEGTGCAIAQSDDRLHPTCGLWPISMRENLASALSSGTRKVTDWALNHNPGIAVFPTTGIDPFFNVNTPEDLARAEAML